MGRTNPSDRPWVHGVGSKGEGFVLATAGLDVRVFVKVFVKVFVRMLVRLLVRVLVRDV
jgi:hypothetical protein